ncbi:MAG: alpha/beta fold hydrolase [Candidatus Eisenbacteria bacterium]|nr:alpha/beta fold hydrolase [Candidatus Eisenbacteria bacterium]
MILLSILLTALAYIGSALALIIAVYIVYMFVIAIIPGIKVPEQPMQPLRGAQRRGERPQPGSREDVSFAVKGTALHAWLYRPQGRTEAVPCIVMAHGLGGTKSAGLDGYAARFQSAGYAVLAFDFRHLGDSEGEPRQLVWIPRQLEDYTASVAFVRGLDGVDPNRIAVWGTSLSGGHVLVTAAKDQRIACAVAQVPVLDGHAGGPQVVKRLGLGHVLKMGFVHGLRDLVRSWLRLTPHRVPIWGRNGTEAMLPDEGAWEAIHQMAPEGFINSVCARIIIRMDKYRPIAQAGKIGCPVLLQVCDKDIGLPARVVEKAAKLLGSQAQVIHYPLDHFDIYLGDDFERAVADQLTFFRTHL